MATYRCYFLDSQGHIEAAENVEAEALEAAIASALAMLKARPGHHSIELWQGARPIYLCPQGIAA